MAAGKAFAFGMALLLAACAPAETFNFNIDWRFARLPGGISGLPAARREIAKDGREFFDPAYDDSRWETVSVPHAVNAHDSYDGHSLDAGEAEFYRGWMFYRKRFTAPKGRRFFLEFECERSSVYLWVNGRVIGFYEAGVVASGYDITAAMRPGENIVAVATDNCAARGTKIVAAETSPGGEPGDWKGTQFQWNGTDFNPVQGGLTGNVNLHVKANDAYITLPLYETLRTKGVYVYAKDFDLAGGEATVCVEPEIVGTGTVRTTLNGQTFAGREGRVKNLAFWSPDTPHLYDVKVELLGADGSVLDAVVVRTGFRHVAYDAEKGGLLINGRNVWLAGYAQRSTDSWAAIGVAPDWLQDFDAELIRASNANFVRWMHVAPKPGPVRAFDKAGIVNVCPAGDKENETQGRQWEQRVEAMRAAIVYFRNSPSILFWEAGNNQISPAHMREMWKLKEELDPHGGRFMGCRTLSAPEQIAEAEYVGTMIHRHDEKAYESMKRLGRFMPMVETEYCREESARRLWDRFSPPDFNFVCRRLASGAKKTGYNCYDMTQEEMAVSNGGTADGYAYFYGNRASGSLGRFYSACAALCWTDCNQHGRNSGTENCRSSGRVDAVRIPKESFHVHSCFYSRTPRIKILGHWNYPRLGPDTYWYREAVNDGKEIAYTGARRQRNPKKKAVTVIASVHCASVELLVNGRSKGVQTKPKGLFYFTFPDIDVTESGTVEAVARDADGREIARDAIHTAGEAAKLSMTLTAGPDGLRADGSDIAFADVALVDAAGRTLPLAGDRVSFRLDGPATFMGGWNSGTFGDTSPVGKDWVNLECGVNRVFLRGGRTPGKVTLTATCGKLSASVALETRAVEVVGGLCLLPQQSRPANARSYAVEETSPPVRDLSAAARAERYKVYVNGVEVAFGRRGRPFKPDASTGVCCAIEPVLAALKAAGADFDYVYHPKKVPAEKRYLRKMGFALKPMVTLTAGGRTVDAVAGATVVFENEGKDRNLTNFEFTGDGRVLVGELGAVLGYIPGISLAADEKAHKVRITVVR